MKPKTAKCALCREVRPLRYSHILPEFVYRPLYDNWGRATGLDSSRKVKEYTVQAGYRQHLLCGECEARFNRWETPAARVLRKVPAPLFRSRQAAAVPAEYAKFKLFALSVVWRMSVSSLPPFARVDLGPHEEPIRSMLLTADPGPRHRYPVLLASIERPNSLHTILGPVVQARVGGRRAYRVMMYGFWWSFIAAADAANMDLLSATLNERGILAIVRVPKSEEQVLREISNYLTKAGLL